MDTGKTLVQIAAILESFLYLLLDSAANFSYLSQFFSMPYHTLIQWTVAGAVELDSPL